ncbi:hypothetical protein FACS1894110_13410 [Spirochaetia bacterium]|nr:hypothetical protein FACS1894110_13410 [Spirochaetia bacterium]
MKERKKPRTVQLPQWMDAAVSELAVKDKRSVSGEIEFLVAAAMRNHAQMGDGAGAIPVLSGTETSMSSPQG